MPVHCNCKEKVESTQISTIKEIFQLSVLFKTTAELGTCNVTPIFLELKIRITFWRIEEGGRGHPKLSE